MPQANQRVGEYVLDEIVGQGAYAQVWRAHHHIWADQIAAVKIPTDPGYLNNLRREGIRVHRLSHPNIVLPIGFDPMAEPPYLMSEFISGGSLRPLCAGRKLSVTDTLNILRQILAALEFAHQQGIIHGDIKPDNVLVEESAVAGGFAGAGSVKVTDFGIGLAASATATGDAAAAKIHAQSGGTLAYLAPEQRDDGAAPDARSDIYAVGVMLFEMLTGERPSGAELPSELNPESPTSLDQVFRRSYARRERRFASAKEFLEALPGNGEQPIAIVPAQARPMAQTAPLPVESSSPLPIEVSPPPPPVRQRATAAAPEYQREANEKVIGFRDDDDAAPARVNPPDKLEVVEAHEEVSAGTVQDEEPNFLDETFEAEDEAAPAKDDSANRRANAVADTQLPAPAGGMEIPPIPRVPSRADRAAVFDELTYKQVRTGEELRGTMKSFFESRDLDPDETNNIRLRLVKWANALVGGDSDFDPQIIISRAMARPLYQVSFITRIFDKDRENTRLLKNPAEEICKPELKVGDYRLLAHLSADEFGPKLFDSIGHAPLRAVVNEMIHESSIVRAIQRQDLFIGRTNIIIVDYQFEGSRQRAFMVGNALEIIAPENPFAKIKDDPTKRAAALLDSEQVRLGIKELRRGLDSKWQEKASVILNALRGKLAAAYTAEAKHQFDGFGWLESLEMTGKAGQLAAGHDAALVHAVLVRKRVSAMQLLPGLAISLVFLVLAVVTSLDGGTRFKVFSIHLLSNTFFAAAIAAPGAALISWKVLALRMSRTDFAFYQAMFLPTLLGAILALAPTRFLNWKGDVICAIIFITVILGDILLFKYFHRFLFRRLGEEQMASDEATVLMRIETLLDQDWERLRPHYLELNPLYSYAGARTQLDRLLRDDDKAASRARATKQAEVREPVELAPPPRAASQRPASSGNADVDRLAAQVVNRINAGARALIPPARMIITLLNEYTKSVSNRQLGMVQSNAQKIEQKGNDLSEKLGDFEQVCKSPLTLDSGDDSANLRELGEEMARRPEEPDFVLLRSMANWAKNFRADQAAAVNELNQLLPEVQEALERLKKL